MILVPGPVADSMRYGSAVQLDQALDQRQTETGARLPRAAFEFFASIRA